MSRIDLRDSLIVAPFINEEPSRFGRTEAVRVLYRERADRLSIHAERPLPLSIVQAIGRAASTKGMDYATEIVLADAVAVPSDVISERKPGDEDFGTSRRWQDGGVFFTEYAAGSRTRVSAFVPGLRIEADAEGLYIRTQDGTRIDLGEGEGEVLIYPRASVPGEARSAMPDGKPRVFPTVAAWVKERNKGEDYRQENPYARVPAPIARLSALPTVRGRRPEGKVIGPARIDKDGFRSIQVGARVEVSFGLAGMESDGPTVIVQHGSEEGPESVLEMVRRFDTQAAQAINAIAIECTKGGKPKSCHASPERIAEMMGKEWRTLDNDQRDKFRAISTVVTHGEIRCKTFDGKAKTVRLFVVTGDDIERNGTHHVRVRLNPELVEGMNHNAYGKPSSLGILMDPRIVSLPIKTDEAIIRLIQEIDRQFSLGWVANNYAKGKPLHRSLGVLFRDAGLGDMVEAQVRDQGKAAAREWMRDKLDRLVMETPGYISRWCAVSQAEDPRDDMVDLFPDRHFAAQASKTRSRAIAKKDAVVEAKASGSRLAAVALVARKKPRAKR